MQAAIDHLNATPLAGLMLVALSIALTNRLTVQPLPTETGWEWLVTDQWTGTVHVCKTPKLFSGESCDRIDLSRTGRGE